MTKLSFLATLIAAPLVFGMFTTGCAADSEDFDEPTGESEDHLLAGRRLSTSEIAGLLRTAGFPESAVGPMVCTAKYESGYYEKASNKNHNGTTDYGLFQINSIHLGGKGCPSSASGLYTAAANAKCAYAVYKSQGINAWYGYQKHRSECNGTKAPASSAPAGGTDDDDDSTPGSCYSSTLAETVDGLTCVESRKDDIWYQCFNGSWIKGVNGNTGPHGTCASVHPLP